MNQQKQTKEVLNLPNNIGRAIAKEGALIACPLLGTDKFIKFCKERSLSVDRERLLRLERLGLFAPIFRVRTPPRARWHFVLPFTKGKSWFKRGWAWDTTSMQNSYEVPDAKDRTQEGYYSIFQIDHLGLILSKMTHSFQMDYFLEADETQVINWDKKGKQLLEIFKETKNSLQVDEYRQCIALLCQFISNRYYPETQSDQRTIKISGRTYSDKWICVNAMKWDWYEYVDDWNPSQTERFFQLTPEKLRHAYERLAIAQESCDPMAKWYQLIQFVSINERCELKSDALKAETLREGAHMLRLLYKDLYGDDLPHPNEVTGNVITHIPEMEVRQDTRRYLEFVANRYRVNPQPKMCLLVEGRTEELVIRQIFEKWFGADPGTYGIEIVALWGVDNATGGKQDKFRAILRLVDYLHHHQTFTFLILDNEKYASRLKKEAKKAKSIHGQRFYVTRSEYIRIWRKSFEFDNYSDTQIAKALSGLAQENVRFTCAEIIQCRNQLNPGKYLSQFYKAKTGRGLPKLKLAKRLVDSMFSKEARKRIENYQIVKTLDRVVELAVRNPFPTMHSVEKYNQKTKYLGKKGR